MTSALGLLRDGLGAFRSALLSVHGTQAVVVAEFGLGPERAPGTVLDLTSWPGLASAVKRRRAGVIEGPSPLNPQACGSSAVLPLAVSRRDLGLLLLEENDLDGNLRKLLEQAKQYSPWLVAMLARARLALEDDICATLASVVPSLDWAPKDLLRHSSQQLAKAAVRLGACDGACVAVLRGGSLLVQAAESMEAPQRAQLGPEVLDRLRLAATVGRPLWVPDALPGLSLSGPRRTEALLLAPLCDSRGELLAAVFFAMGQRTASHRSFVVAEEMTRRVSPVFQQLLHAHETRLLGRTDGLGQELGQALTLTEMFRVLARWLPRFVPDCWLGLFQVDPYEGSLALSHHTWIGKGRRRANQPPLLLDLRPVLKRARRSKEPIFLPGGSGGRPASDAQGATAVMPVRVGEQTDAMLLVHAERPGAFSSSELRALREISRAVAPAFRTARVFEMIETAKRDWEQTFDAITDTLAIISPNLTIRRINMAFAEERGLHPKELVGKPCYQMLYQLDAPCAACPVQRGVLTKTVATAEIRSADERTLYEVSVFPIENGAGETVNVVEYAKDITLSRALEQELLETERLRALGEMASGVAHDFNNTLAAVLGQTDLLLNQVADPAIRHQLEVVAQAASDGAATVRRIQNFTRAQRDEEYVPVDLNHIALDAVEVSAPRWKHQAQQRGIPIQVETVLVAEHAVLGNPSELREVLVNILFNSVEAMPRGGTITLKTWEQSRGSDVFLSVADTGVGMCEETRRHIFEPFFTTKGPSGSGLGMSVAYGIIKLHNGDISVDSTEGQGTTITIRLPAALAPVLETLSEEQPLASRTDWKVLVIEDSPQLADLLAQMLELDYGEVTRCTDGAAALDLLATGSYQLVVTDLAMPEISGWEIADAVANLEPRPFLTLVTGSQVQMEDHEAVTHGVDAIIEKPYTLASVRRALASLPERTAPAASRPAAHRQPRVTGRLHSHESEDVPAGRFG